MGLKQVSVLACENFIRFICLYVYVSICVYLGEHVTTCLF